MEQLSPRTTTTELRSRAREATTEARRFEEYWSGTLHNGPQFCFLVIGLGLWILKRKTIEVKCHSHHILSGVHCLVPTPDAHASDVKWDISKVNTLPDPAF